ncbi:thioredoxin-like [Lissotriton helveticus]
MIKEVCSLGELDSALKSAGNKLVFVNYSSPKCGLCKGTDRLIQGLCEERPHIIFLKINTEEAKEFIDHFKITGLPAFQYYRGTKKLYEFAGANKDHIMKMLCEFDVGS